MTGPSSNTARYDLYSNSARTTLWGSWETGYDSAGVQLDVNKGATVNVTVYGRFFASQQTLATGSYTATFSANPFIRYANEGETFVFWSKGDGAFVEEGPSQTVTYSNCVGQ